MEKPLDWPPEDERCAQVARLLRQLWRQVNDPPLLIGVFAAICGESLGLAQALASPAEQAELMTYDEFIDTFGKAVQHGMGFAHARAAQRQGESDRAN
jgi:malonyl CoA-acyl carrier protein transacylase